MNDNYEFEYFTSLSFTDISKEFIEQVKEYTIKNIFNKDDKENILLKIVANPHDFWTYYSLDIYTKRFWDDGDCDEDAEIEENDKIYDRANKISDLINKKYEDYL